MSCAFLLGNAPEVSGAMGWDFYLLMRWLVVWTVAKEDEERRKRATMDAAKAAQKEADARREEMRREAGLGKN